MMKSIAHEAGGSVLYPSRNREPTELLREARDGYLCTLEKKKYSSSNIEDGREGKETRKGD